MPNEFHPLSLLPPPKVVTNTPGSHDACSYRVHRDHDMTNPVGFSSIGLGMYLIVRSPCHDDDPFGRKGRDARSSPTTIIV